ncbi:hypothetical protein AVEN_273244-1 [Araneus ventricosus]|uniref:Uncharacterized protein n=1 Tax=Araneus ventricosus TaxID=182803 RepID=A0A4Y2W4Y2_ARAVE|nr:hypothetical protein AVEN_273244-1 [Araneus ventricosus]
MPRRRRRQKEPMPREYEDARRWINHPLSAHTITISRPPYADNRPPATVETGIKPFERAYRQNIAPYTSSPPPCPVRPPVASTLQNERQHPKTISDCSEIF